MQITFGSSLQSGSIFTASIFFLLGGEISSALIALREGLEEL